MLLQIDNLHVSLEGLKVLQGIELHVNDSELVVVIGANGAGKTTLLRAICGLVEKEQGTVFFDGKDMTKLSSSDIAKEGLCMVPQGRQLFAELSAQDNLLTGAYKFRKDRERVQRNLKKIYETFPVLERNKDRMASTFSGGEQQMITLGRGLMSEPKLMMIDELSLGLAPLITIDLFKKIKEFNQQGMSILLIEQNARQALGLADRAYVVENGVVSLEGTGEELLNDPKVKEAYLGM